MYLCTLCTLEKMEHKRKHGENHVCGHWPAERMFSFRRFTMMWICPVGFKLLIRCLIYPTLQLFQTYIQYTYLTSADVDTRNSYFIFEFHQISRTVFGNVLVHSWLTFPIVLSVENHKMHLNFGLRNFKFNGRHRHRTYIRTTHRKKNDFLTYNIQCCKSTRKRKTSSIN